MELISTCNYCKKQYIINTLERGLMFLEYCSKECNEKYFEDNGNGTIPDRYKDTFHINKNGIAIPNKKVIVLGDEDGNN